MLPPKVKKIYRPFAKPLLILMMGTLLVFFVYQLLQINIPDIRFLKEANPTLSNYMIFDDHSQYNLEDKTTSYTKLSQISPALITAVLVAEDDLFFEHHGFNWAEFQNSLKINLKKKRFARGGSTITQQLARNLFLSKDKTILRKIREWILTYQIESLLPKARILELYLNVAEFGPGIYGVAAGSSYHFHTQPKHLSKDQASLLAAVLPNPKYYGKKPYPAPTLRRKNKILYRMQHYAINRTLLKESTGPLLKKDTERHKQEAPPTQSVMQLPLDESMEPTETIESLPMEETYPEHEEVFVDE